MNIKKAALGLTLATSLLGVSSCAQNTGNQPIDQRIAHLDAQPNNDGNYNIVFVTVDQEHYFDEFPAGTNYKARELLKKRELPLKNIIPAAMSPPHPDLSFTLAPTSRIR